MCPESFSLGLAFSAFLARKTAADKVLAFCRMHQSPSTDAADWYHKGTLTVATTSPSAENADRISKFWHYYDSAGTDQKLRTAVLCLSLTEHALNISSSKMKEPGREPTLVRLAKGEVQEKTLDQLDTILGLLHLDASLDIVDTMIQPFPCLSQKSICLSDTMNIFNFLTGPTS